MDTNTARSHLVTLLRYAGTTLAIMLLISLPAAASGRQQRVFLPVVNK